MSAQTQAPITQEKAGFRQRFPEWVRQLPKRDIKAPNPNFKLIDPNALDTVLKDAKPETVKRIKEDLEFLDHELLRLFRDLDYQAKVHQNRYRLIQISYMILAALATLFGSLLALTVNSQPQFVPWFAFGEFVVALATTYIATISGREAPLALWLENRRKSEYLRREYYRYLMDLAPYDKETGYRRKRLLSVRAADINRGIYPEVHEV
jgi:hypothetical protein